MTTQNKKTLEKQKKKQSLKQNEKQYRPQNKKESRGASVGEAKEHILRVATRLFAEHGLHGISVRDIARETKLNLSLVSYYFGGKEGLYKAVMQFFATNAQQNLTTMFSIHPEKLDKKVFIASMREFISKFIELRMQSRDISVIFYRERLSGLPMAREIYESTFASIGSMMVDLIVQAQKKKIVSEDVNPYDFALFLSEGIQGYINAHECETTFMVKCTNLQKDKEKVIDQLVLIYLQGVLK